MYPMLIQTKLVTPNPDDASAATAMKILAQSLSMTQSAVFLLIAPALSGLG